jgi:hypothetical protein
MPANAPVQLYSTGPAHMFVGKPAAAGSQAVGPFYLGTAKVSPVIQIKPNHRPVYNDIGGDEAFDMAYMGQLGMTSVELTRWSDPVLRILSAHPAALSVTDGTELLNGPLDTGSLILTENLNFSFWVLFPFNAKAAYSKMTAGYRFPGPLLLGPDIQKQMGTHPREISLVFLHLRIYNGLTGNLFLGDHDMSAIKNVALI